MTIMMATEECTRESVLDFLRENGGRVKNKLLVAHFKAFLSSDSNRREKRERFKSFVDSVAYVRQEDGEKVVCLKRRYRASETSCGLAHQTEGGEEAEEMDGEKRDSNQDTEQEENLHEEPEMELKMHEDPEMEMKMDGDPEMEMKVHEEPEMEIKMREVSEMEMKMYEEPEEMKMLQEPEPEMKMLDEPDVKSRVFQKSDVIEEACEVGMHEKPDLETKERNQRASEKKRSTSEKSASAETESSSGGDQICVSDITLMRSSLPRSESSRSEPELFPARGSRRSTRQLLIGSSPQVRGFAIHRSSRSLQSLRSSVFRSSSSSVDEECMACVTLEPLEHEWMLSSAEGEWSSLQHLLLCDPELFPKRDFITGFTCLHWAAKHGKHELIVRLCNFAKESNLSININVRSSAGYTPLHLAAMHGHTEVMKLLIGAYDADVELRDFNGKKASHYLKSSTSGDILDIVGVPESQSSESATGSGRWKLPRVLQSNLNPLRLLNVAEESGAEPKHKPLGRKSSLSRIRMQGKRVGTRIVHSASFRERQEQQGAAQSPARTRPTSDLFT